MFREFTPVSYISLKTDRTNYRERCWKRIPRRVDPVDVIDSSTKGFLEILSNVLVAQEKRLSSSGLTLLNVIDSSTKGLLEILSNVLVAQEKRLSFMYGRPDESCTSFALMYFGKRRASRINLFWSR